MALLLALLIATVPCPHPQRSASKVASFKKLVPMPQKCYNPDGTVKTRVVKLKNGLTRRIKDCVVDHACALECCGADNIPNMQWQTYAESVLKDKYERSCSKYCNSDFSPKR